MNADATAPHAPADLLDPAVLTARAYEVDGVTDVYPPAASITQLPQMATALATGSPQALNRVGTTTHGDTVAIAARIATQREIPAPDVAHRVADALLASIPEATAATVDVQVSRIA